MRAIRLIAPTLAIGDIITATYPVSTLNLPPNNTAWNTAAAFATDATGVTTLLPAETPKIGLGNPFSDVNLSKRQVKTALVVGDTARWIIDVQHGTTSSTDANGVVSYSSSTGQIAVGTAKNVVIEDILPAGWTIAGVTVPPGTTFNAATGVWTIGDVRVNDSFSLDIRATATAPMADQRNFAQVLTQTGPTDVNSTPGNCTLTTVGEDDCAQSITNIPVAASSIGFTKLVESSRGSGVYIDASDPAATIGIYSSGQPVRYRFEVTNPTSIWLTDVTITDAQLGSDCTPARFNVAPNSTATINCEWTGGWPTGLTTNTASVTAQPSLELFRGQPHYQPVGAVVTASDTAIVTVNRPPAIQVVKTVNGAAAETSATAAAVATGGTVTLGYVITKRGVESVVVSNLVDDNELGLVFDAAHCTRADGLPLTDPVAANATIVCSLDTVATLGLVLGTATVQGSGVTSLTSVFDTGPGYYLATPAVPSVSISVLTNGIAVASASTAPALALGSRVTWTYVVTNTGNDRLRGVTVTDNREGAATCPATTLLPGEVMTCTIVGTAGLSPYTNTAAVAASGVLSNTPVTAADTSYYRGVILDAARLLGVTGSSPPLIGSVLGLTILLAGAGMLFLSTRRRRTLFVSGPR